MKTSLRRLSGVILFLIITAAFITVLSSCTPSARYQEKVIKYLDKKYGTGSYELISCEQNRGMSGRYEVKALRKDTNTEFDVYVYSTVLITDSYSVDYVNKVMEDIIKSELSEYDFCELVEDIQWLDRFEDDAENYSFRTVDVKSVSFKLRDIKSLYCVTTTDTIAAPLGIVNFARDTVRIMDDNGIKLDSVTFKFEIEDVQYRLSTSSEAILADDGGELLALVEARVNDEKEKVFKSVNCIDIIYPVPASEDDGESEK